MKRIEQVRYDLLVAEEENGAPAAIVYRRTGLPSNVHEIETALVAGKRYFCSVRPRFVLDRREFVSEWAERAPATVLTPIRTRQSFTAPSPSSYRFKTPAAGNSADRQSLSSRRPEVQWTQPNM